jgi:heme exporter protein B
MESITKADAHPSGTVSASMLWVALLFSAASTLPRSFLAEEEHGTADLLRLTARPHAVFWGKSIFNALQTVVTGGLLSFLYLGFTNTPVNIPWLFVVSLIAGCLSLASAVTLCGAIAAQAANRAVLSAAVAVPLLLPLVALGVSGMRVSLGDGFFEGGRSAALGLVGYAVATMTTGPWIFAAVWKS